MKSAISRGRLVVCLLGLIASLPSPCSAGWPWRSLEGTPRVDVLGPLGNRLPESYRRKYNRPTYIGGKIASYVSPSSQEAIAWEKAEALGLYDNNGVKGAMAGKHCPPQRVERHYFYPKPWEVLTTGPRLESNYVENDEVDTDSEVETAEDQIEMVPLSPEAEEQLWQRLEANDRARDASNEVSAELPEPIHLPAPAHEVTFD